MKIIGCFFAVLAFVGIMSCSSVHINDYANEKPALVLEEYLNGTLDSYGIVQDRSGKVTKRFHCLIKGSWKDGLGTLDEDFTYSDGTKSHRVWTIKKETDKKYIGTAADVVGEAIGTVEGNALRWNYVLSLDNDGKNYHLDFDDWMFLMDSQVMLNKSKMSKYGIYLGEVTLSFHKRDQ